MLAAIERGWVQQEIQQAAYEYQRAVDTGEATVVGVNRFTVENDPPIPTQHIDEDLERKQVERVRALRARRDGGPWQASLDRIREHARMRGQPDAGDSRSGREVCNGGRDRLDAARGLWGVSGDGGGLIVSLR